jgi:hypothetical protein
MQIKSLHPIQRGRFSSLALLPVAFLPGLLFILTLKYLNASGWADGDGTFQLFALCNALCSLGVAFLFIRSFSLAGMRRVVATILLSVVLYFAAYVVTLILQLLVIGLAV